jgi:tRNA(Glu) U13 pseudouridine synthase TruD
LNGLELEDWGESGRVTRHAKQLHVPLPGSTRPVFVTAKEIQIIEATDSLITLQFFLPKGAYATVFLTEFLGGALFER